MEKDNTEVLAQIAKYHYSEASQILRCLVLAAIKRMQTLGRGDQSVGSEDNPARFGNVEFWTADNGDFCYSLPPSAWDTEAVTKDLQYWF